MLQHLEGVPRFMALLLYGAGLRLLERARLRVKEVDFAANQITVRSGKGAKDRTTNSACGRWRNHEAGVHEPQWSDGGSAHGPRRNRPHAVRLRLELR